MGTGPGSEDLDGFWRDLARGKLPLESYDIPSSYPAVEHLSQGQKLLRHFRAGNTPAKRRWLTFLLRSLALPPGGSVLEIGPGCGNLAIEFCKRGYRYTGFDMVPENADLWRLTAPFYGLDGTLKVQDICEAADPRDHFDGIFSISTFEHIHDRNTAISHCHAMLKPGGRLVIIDGNFLDPRTLWRQVVVRPIQSRGRQGGLKWLLNREEIFENYGLGWRGKEEAVMSVFWWRRNLPRFGFRVVTCLTSGYFYPTPRRLGLWPYVGNVFVVGEKHVAGTEAR